MPLPSIRVGVAGWDYRHWDGPVYPRGWLTRFHPLEFLAERVDCIEIANTFHEVVRPELMHLWTTRVRHNPQFRFTVRLHRDFTHDRLLQPCRINRFCESVRPLIEQKLLGCVLMQFPFSFRFTAENRAFLVELRRAFHEFPLVAELRHDSWTMPEAMGTLIDYHVGYANLDQPQHMRAARPGSALTTGIAYVKMHGRQCGPDHFGFETAKAARSGNRYLYSTEELSEWKPRIARLGQFAEQVYVIFNNDGGGKSVVNALQMRTLLDVAAGNRRLPQATGAAEPQSDLFVAA